eukprot:SAG31_NODE_45818_length_257_cov_0.658228_1_plen_60_part_10
MRSPISGDAIVASTHNFTHFTDRARTPAGISMLVEILKVLPRTDDRVPMMKLDVRDLLAR